MATLLHIPLSLDFCPSGQLDVNVTEMPSGSPSWLTIILEESFCKNNIIRKVQTKMHLLAVYFY